MKAIEVLKKLSATQRNRFKKFLESPYFNVNSDLVTLFIVLDSDLRLDIDPVKEKVWSRCMTKVPFDDKKWRKMLTSLLSLLERFVAVESLQENKLLLSNIGLQGAIRLDIPALMSNASKHFEKSLDHSPRYSVDTQWLEVNYLKNRQYIITDFERKQEADKSEAHREDLLKLDRVLDRAYLQEKLRIACAFEHYSFVYNFDENIHFEKEVLKMANKMDEGDHGVKIYQKTLSAYRTTFTRDFINQLFLQLRDNARHFSLNDSKDIYINLLNLVILKVGRGHEEYERLLLQLFQFGLNNSLLLEQGKISPSIYRNIAFIAAKLKEYDWALAFVEKNKDALEDKYKETAYSFNRARILRQMGKYDLVIETLRNVEYEDITYNLNSKLILMISYFELEEYAVLDSFIKSFKVFLRRRRNIPKARKNAFYSFTKVLHNIMKAEERLDAKRLKAAAEDIAENTSIPNRDWLKEKIEVMSRTIKIPVVE